MDLSKYFDRVVRSSLTQLIISTAAHVDKKRYEFGQKGTTAGILALGSSHIHMLLNLKKYFITVSMIGVLKRFSGLGG